MASVPADKLSHAEKDQLAVSYAAFILQGSGADINADSLNAVLKAAGLKPDHGLVNSVAKALKGRNVTDFFGAVGAGEAAPAKGAETKPAETKAEKGGDKGGKGDKGKDKPQAPPPPPPPAAEEEEVDMGDLFG